MKQEFKSKKRILDFNTKIVGREKELEKILNISNQVVDEGPHNNHILINGDIGVGKTRLLREVDYQLKIRGHDVYFVKVKKDDASNINSMISVLRQTTRYAPEDLLDKYRSELAKTLPEFKLVSEEETLNETTQDIEKLRLYDRISRYLEELSRESHIFYYR